MLQSLVNCHPLFRVISEHASDELNDLGVDIHELFFKVSLGPFILFAQLEHVKFGFRHLKLIKVVLVRAAEQFKYHLQLFVSARTWEERLPSHHLRQDAAD